MKPIALLLLLPGCMTELSILPRPPQDETVFSPPPLDYHVEFNPPAPNQVEQWRKLYIEWGFSPEEASKRAESTLRMK